MRLSKKSKLITLVIGALGFCLFNPAISFSQEKLPPDTSVVTKNHKLTINGQAISYDAIVGTLPVFVDHNGVKSDTPEAYVQYTYYKRTGIDDSGNRPILFSFNGGPGTGSLWMHIGYTGPKRLKIGPEGWPIQPYGVEDNHYSILDVTDLVYINPVNTGYSRIINGGKREDFFGVKADITYLADWIELFLSRYSRWDSPKFLIGESYGTTRVAGLAGVLQSRNNIFLNGVILQGNCGIGLTPNRSSPAAAVLDLPSYTCAAWYHKKLPQDLQSQDLTAIYPEVEDFTINKLLPAVAKGGSLGQQEREEIAKQVARYSGLSEEFVLNHNLVVSSSAFWKELLRNEGKTIGRLDTRYVGIDEMNAGERSDYNAEILSWEHSFTPAINKYFREGLGFKTDIKYYVFGPVRPWGGRSNSRDMFNVGDELRQAMEENPALKLFNQQGYYDGACTVMGAKYSLWHLDPRDKLKDRIDFKAYESGHMLYVRKADLIQGSKDLRAFIKDAIPKDNQPIKY